MTNQITESGVHELGHAIDSLDSYPSTGDTFASYIAADSYFLNAAGYGCSTAGTAPYDSVYDTSAVAPFCASGFFSNYDYNGLPNSTIAGMSTVIFNQQHTPAGTGYPELFAQAFVYAAYVGSLTPPPYSGYLITTADSLFQRAYYACVIWNATELLGEGLPEPAYCE